MKQIVESYFAHRSMVNHQLASYNDCIPGDGRASRMERIVRGIRIGSDDPLAEVPGGEDTGEAKSILSIGLGCEAKYAKDFVYTENLNINEKKTEIPIGVSCRTCDRLDCSQRAFPPLHKKFDVDINSRGISVYVSE